MTELTLVAPTPNRGKEAVADCESAYRKQGSRSGPLLIVIGEPDVLAPVIRRMEAVESLCYMRGTVEFHTEKPSNKIADGIVTLGQPGQDSDDLSDFENPYWMVLRRAARLGMISGRGVPLRARKPQRCVNVQRMTGDGWKQRIW